MKTFFRNEPSVQEEPQADDLLSFCKTPRTRQEIADFLGVKTVFYAMQHYVKPLLDSGLLRMTIPDKPKSSKQKYYSVDRSKSKHDYRTI